MGKKSKYAAKVKMIVGALALTVCIPALAFALFGWSQTTGLLGVSIRFLCIFGCVGAMATGTLLLNESLTMKKAFAAKNVRRAIREPTLDFLVMLEYEAEKNLAV